MDKKIIKSLFNEIASKDTLRPVMNGVHFEDKWCVATDTKVLIVYNETDPRFIGQTIDCNGQPLKGNYPDVRRVIPKENSNEFKGDLCQLYRALAWWPKQKDAHSDDRVVIGEQTFMMSTLRRFLSVYYNAYELAHSKFYLNEQGRCASLICDKFTGIIMPCTPTPEDVIDDVRSYESMVTVSFANLINTFAIEGSKPQEAPVDKWGWL